MKARLVISGLVVLVTLALAGVAAAERFRGTGGPDTTSSTGARATTRSTAATATT
jgi:hypothetical protein